MAPFIDAMSHYSSPTDIVKMKESNKELFFIGYNLPVPGDIREVFEWCCENIVDQWNLQFRHASSVEFVTNHKDAALLFKMTWNAATKTG